MQKYEVDHVTESDAIRKISHDASQQQRTSAKNSIVISRRPEKVVRHRDGCQHSEDHKEPTSKCPAFLQLSERDAGIFCVNKVHKPTNHRAVLTVP